MAIEAISFGKRADANNNSKKKLSPMQKGAIIGAATPLPALAVGEGLAGAVISTINDIHCKSGFKNTITNTFNNFKKGLCELPNDIRSSFKEGKKEGLMAIFIVVALTAISAWVGLGIGKLCEVISDKVKANKEAKANKVN